LVRAAECAGMPGALLRRRDFSAAAHSRCPPMPLFAGLRDHSSNEHTPAPARGAHVGRSAYPATEGFRKPPESPMNTRLAYELHNWRGPFLHASLSGPAGQTSR